MHTLHDSRHASAQIDDAGIAMLRLRDASALSIIGSAAIAERRQALASVSAQPRRRVLVLPGNGERAFIGGADIGEMAALTPDTDNVFISHLARLRDAVGAVSVPVIARLADGCWAKGWRWRWPAACAWSTTAPCSAWRSSRSVSAR